MTRKSENGIKMGKKYFTLHELLLIIAIAGFLFALGAASLDHAAADPKLVKCTDNLKRFSQIFASYAEENENYTPESLPGNNSGRNWWKLVAMNMKPLPGMKDWNNPGLVKEDFGPFKCPENTKQIYLSNFFGPQDNRTQSYCANTFNGYNENRYMGTRVSNFKTPDRLIALFEGNYGRVAVWNNTAGDCPEKVSELRHDGKMNVLYADGHVALHEGVLPYSGDYKGGQGGVAAAYPNGAMWFAE